LKKLFYIIIPALFLCGCKENNEAITIACSANMQFAIEEIAAEFTTQTKIETKLVISSSGKLTSQIEQGAPFDILIAANTKLPKHLDSLGLTLKKPEVYAFGKLVLWTLKDINPSLDILTSDTIKKIAIANPKTAPYGKASIETLKKHNLYDLVKNKLVFGESISQVNQFVTTQSADIGFTALSIVSANNIKTKGSWTTINDSDHNDIEQAAALIKQNHNMQAATDFYNFLFSQTAQEILNKYGYLSAQL